MRFHVYIALALCLLLTPGCQQNSVETASNLPVVEAKTPPTKSPPANTATLDRVRHIISEQMGTKIEALIPETSLADLKADDLDFVELVMQLEEAFDISIPDDRAEQLAGGNLPTGFKQVTVRKLAALVDELSSKSSAKIVRSTNQTSAEGAKTENSSTASIKPWSDEKLQELLGRRVDGGIGSSFGQFANMFLVMSRLHLGPGVGLMTPSKEIAKAELQPVFPESYQPTLRELLDVIAWQTSSQWQYDPSSKYFQSDVDRGPVEDLVFFEFTKGHREKPFQVDLPNGWKAVDRGHWVMFVPPVSPMAVDLHELGTYSSDDKAQEPQLLKDVPRELAMEWAKRAKDQVDPSELKLAKVDEHDAYYFETMMPLQDGSKVRWRHWIFMVGNKCYGFVSTIFPEFENRLFPEVQSIVASFKAKDTK